MKIELDSFKIAHGAKNLVAFKFDATTIVTKDNFLAFLADSIKTIEIEVDSSSKSPSREAGHRYPPKEHGQEENTGDSDNAVDFLKLKDKIEDWKQKITHSEPYIKFYVKSIDTCCFNLIIELLSFHPDNNQTGIK